MSRNCQRIFNKPEKKKKAKIHQIQKKQQTFAKHNFLATQTLLLRKL
jgi:hypothetical protein